MEQPKTMKKTRKIKTEGQNSASSGACAAAPPDESAGACAAEQPGKKQKSLTREMEARGFNPQQAANAAAQILGTDIRGKDATLAGKRPKIGRQRHQV